MINHLRKVYSVRYLGVILDNTLDWNKHISYLTGKLSSSAGILRKLKHFIPLKSLVMVYYSIDQSYLQYAVTSWGNAAWKCLRKLQEKQNDIIRIVTNKQRFRTKLIPLYNQLNLLQIKNIYKLKGSIFMYKFHCEKLPYYFHNYFCKSLNVHSHYTRSSNNSYFLPRSNFQMTDSSFRITGPKIWYSLPPTIQNNLNKILNSFRNSLKAFKSTE